MSHGLCRGTLAGDLEKWKERESCLLISLFVLICCMFDGKKESTSRPDWTGLHRYFSSRARAASPLAKAEALLSYLPCVFTRNIA